MTTVAITQSNYIPWKGYFDTIDRVDHLVLLDEVQYTKRDWRNRNRIKTPTGTRWLTVPVQVKGKYHQRIDETLVADGEWPMSHWQTIAQSYRRVTPHFDRYATALEDAYGGLGHTDRLSEVNRALIETLCGLLGIATPMSWSTEHPSRDGPTERLLDICVDLGATRYVSGPAAKAYMDLDLFAAAGIEVEWAEHRYPEYEQPHGEFDHHVSVVDLLFCVGPESLDHLRHGRSLAS